MAYTCLSPTCWFHAREGITAGIKRFNSRENINVVAVVSAGGMCIPSLIIFKGKRFNPARVEGTDSPFM